MGSAGCSIIKRSADKYAGSLTPRPNSVRDRSPGKKALWRGKNLAGGRTARTHVRRGSKKKNAETSRREYEPRFRLVNTPREISRRLCKRKCAARASIVNQYFPFFILRVFFHRGRRGFPPLMCKASFTYLSQLPS